MMNSNSSKINLTFFGNVSFKHKSVSGVSEVVAGEHLKYICPFKKLLTLEIIKLF